ncbi:15111_t:CDS:2, partial [Gigaspora rosea]
MDQYYYHSVPESAARYRYSNKGAQYQAKEIRPPRKEIEVEIINDEGLEESNKEALVKVKDAKEDQTKQPLERKTLRLACDNWTRKVSKFRKVSSKEPIGIKLTEIKEAPDIGSDLLNEIENKTLEWNLKSAEGLEKASKDTPKGQYGLEFCPLKRIYLEKVNYQACNYYQESFEVRITKGTSTSGPRRKRGTKTEKYKTLVQPQIGIAEV